MQNAGQQYVQGGGGTSIHQQPQAFVGHNQHQTDQTGNGNSITSSLRQFRKEKQSLQDSNGNATTLNESQHVARVAPHNHYPATTRPPPDCFRYPGQYQDYSLTSQSLDPSAANGSNPKPRPPEMCNPLPPQPYVSAHTDIPSHHMGPPRPIYHQPGPPQIPNGRRDDYLTAGGGRRENDFLSKLQRIHPTMARSIMSDHHLQEAAHAAGGSYRPPGGAATAGMEQNRMYGLPAHQGQTYMNYAPPPSAYGPPPSHHTAYMPTAAGQPPYPSAYPPASCSYASPASHLIPPHGVGGMGGGGPYHHHQGGQYGGAASTAIMQKGLYSGYGGHPPPQEYAQHYQHRSRGDTAAAAYYQQHCRPTQFASHQLASSEIQENRAPVSNNLKQFLENWAEEEAVTDMQMETNELCKDGNRISRDDQSAELYMVNASELKYFENTGIPLVTEAGIPLQVTSENGQYIIKNGMSLDNTTGLRIYNKTGDIDLESGERVVNVHIMDTVKPDCMHAGKACEMNQRKPDDFDENPRVVIHQNTVIQSSFPNNINITKERGSVKRGTSLPVINENDSIDQQGQIDDEITKNIMKECKKETVDKNCSPINLGELEDYKDDSVIYPSKVLEELDNKLSDNEAKLKNMPTIDEFDEATGSKIKPEDSSAEVVNQNGEQSKLQNCEESTTEETDKPIKDETIAIDMLADAMGDVSTEKLEEIEDCDKISDKDGTNSEFTNGDESPIMVNANSLFTTEVTDCSYKRTKRIFSVDDIINNIGHQFNKTKEPRILDCKYCIEVSREFLIRESKNVFQKVNKLLTENKIFEKNDVEELKEKILAEITDNESGHSQFITSGDTTESNKAANTIGSTAERKEVAVICKTNHSNDDIAFESEVSDLKSKNDDSRLSVIEREVEKKSQDGQANSNIAPVEVNEDDEAKLQDVKKSDTSEKGTSQGNDVEIGKNKKKCTTAKTIKQNKSAIDEIGTKCANIKKKSNVESNSHAILTGETDINKNKDRTKDEIRRNISLSEKSEFIKHCNTSKSEKAYQLSSNIDNQETDSTKGFSNSTEVERIKKIDKNTDNKGILCRSEDNTIFVQSETGSENKQEIIVSHEKSENSTQYGDKLVPSLNKVTADVNKTSNKSNGVAKEPEFSNHVLVDNDNKLNDLEVEEIKDDKQISEDDNIDEEEVVLTSEITTDPLECTELPEYEGKAVIEDSKSEIQPVHVECESFPIITKKNIEDAVKVSPVVPDQPEVQYRNVVRVEDSSILLDIAGELVDINVSTINGKKVITVVPLSHSTIVDFNDNYDIDENSPIDPLKIDDPGAEENSIATSKVDVIEPTSEIIIGMDLNLEEEIQLDLEQPKPVCTKAAKKAYDCDLQIPSVTTSDDINDTNQTKSDSSNDKVSSSKGMRDSNGSIIKKHPSKGSKKKIVKFSSDESCSESKSPRKPLSKSEEEEFVPFTDLVKARKIKKMKLKQLKDKYKADSTNKVDEVKEERVPPLPKPHSNRLEDKFIEPSEESRHKAITSINPDRDKKNDETSKICETNVQKKYTSSKTTQLKGDKKNVEAAENMPSKEIRNRTLISVSQKEESLTPKPEAKRKLSLEEYNNRKKKMMAEKELVAKHVIKPTEEHIAKNYQLKKSDLEDTAQTESSFSGEDISKHKSVSSLDISQSPKGNLNCKKDLTEVKDHVTGNKLRTRSVSDCSEDEILQNYKEQVESKLSTLNLHIPTVVKPKPNAPNIIQRFLKNDKVTKEEVDKIREIILLKKLMQLKPPEVTNNSNLKFRVEDSSATLHLKELPTKKKKKRFRNLYADSSDSEEELQVEKGKSGDYSVVQSNRTLAGVVPKLIIKRKTDIPLPIVRLERLDLDVIGNKKKKYG